MENSFAVNILDGSEQLVHKHLHFFGVELRIFHDRFIKILVHKLENKGEFA